MTIVEMRVHMDCPGCESKIKKGLLKTDGVDDIDIDMGMQKVTVTGWTDQNKVLETVRKTGRVVELWALPYNPEYNEFTPYYYHQNHPQSPPPVYMSQPTSLYNYHVYGYNSHDYDYYGQPLHSTVIDEKASSLFSDENSHSCSIM